MFKLQRPTNTNKPSKPRPERVEFKFYNFQAIQVPKGWDRLFVSLIHVETGKTMAKLGKSLVRNGSCQWSEALSEFIYLSRDDLSKAYEECLVKILISTGSTRSSILGEVTINMAHFTSSRVASAVSQPLKKSNYGTILQVKIQCLTPRSTTKDVESKSLNSQEKDGDVHYRDTDNGSFKSDSSSDSPLKLDSEETSQSASGTTRSFDSLDESIGRQNEEAFNRRSIGSSKHLLEASEDTIGELRAEAIMWERNARKLMIDLDSSEKEFSDQSRKHSELLLELSAAHSENDGLKKEVEKLKLDLEELTKNQCTRDPIVPSENLVQIQKVLESEMKYQQDLSDSIGQQLKRSQESNIELVSVLQELEETIEKQSIEIGKLGEALRDNKDELENERKSNIENLLQLTNEIGVLKVRLRNMSSLEDEISILRSELQGCKDDKGRLELVSQTISGDYELLKAENILVCENISILQDVNLVLKEKLMQTETAKEIIRVQNEELKNEASEIKRENVQFQKKMYRLEEENIECLKKAQALEEELKSMESNKIRKERGYNRDFHDQRTLSVSMDHGKQRVRQESRNSSSKKAPDDNGEVIVRERFERTKSSLEAELRELKDRYLEMSLKYAVVESEREDLVMQLKANRGGRRWFS